MKLSKSAIRYFLCVLVVLLSGGAAANFYLNWQADHFNEPRPLKRTHDGVYYAACWYQTIIVELQHGRFRYWSSSDFGTTDSTNAEQQTIWAKYPVSGQYSASNGIVTFQYTAVTAEYSKFPHEQNWSIIRTQQWVFVKYEGKVTLWTPECLENWTRTKKVDYFVLQPTKRQSEELFTNWCHNIEP